MTPDPGYAGYPRTDRGPDWLPLRTAIDGAAGDLWLSPISVWEIGMLHANGRVELRKGPRAWVERAMRELPVKEAALTAQVALRSHELGFGHRDPADHLLAATALVHGLTLVTLDERLTGLAWLPTLTS